MLQILTHLSETRRWVFSLLLFLMALHLTTHLHST